MKEVQVPTHPIPSMQLAFAESMLQSSTVSTPTIPSNRPGNAAARRKILLDQDISEDTHATRWRQKPGQVHHELWKLMAQISFGIYLLLNGIAKDDEQVMNILQGHVNEVDEFLEKTLEDFDLAQEDIEERLKFLKLPLENIIIFDAMLEDRSFRLQIVNGNERIEHVITRTATAMNDALKDVQHGIDACKEFTIYLAKEQEHSVWRDKRPDMQKVFDAMKGNVEGWYKAYVSLQTKGNHLGTALVQLGTIVAEMDRRAGEISRKTRVGFFFLRNVFVTDRLQFSTSTASPMASPPASPPEQTRHMRMSMSKTLPSDPNSITPAIRATLPAFQLVQDRERTPEPDYRSSTSSDLEEPEPDFILKPHTYSPAPSPILKPHTYSPAPSPILKPYTYSPAPSPKPPSAPSPIVPTAPVQEVPEVRKRSSLRQRFSLKRKDVPPEETLRAPQPIDDRWGPRQRVQSVVAAPSRGRDSSIATPPSRGLDSAYCSDFEKTSPPVLPHLTQTNSGQSSNTANSSRNTHFVRDYVSSPRSEQQFFRPVQASPHSPLQRPWTAGPMNPLHAHSNSSTSNLSARNYHTHTPSQLGNRHMAPSAMGMSMRSEMTMMTEIGPDGERKKVKKKRSAFGWLKKAFSLSEEEKMAFEEKRRMADIEASQYYERGPQRWIDGKRVDNRRVR
jgi:hypothetical protein